MNLRAFFAEFVGTFTLIFIGVAAIASNHVTQGDLGMVGIALAHGLAIAVMVSATAAVSGGHLNPAVTFGAYIARKIDTVNATGYVVAQCLGGLAAAWIVGRLFAADVMSAIGWGTPLPGAGVDAGQAILAEIVLTFFLVFVVFGTGIDPRAPKVGGLFIGLTVTLDILAGGAISGGAMNPARHLGPALLGGHAGTIWMYWVGPLIGGGLAALAYHHILERRT